MFQVSMQPTSWCFKANSRSADSAFNCTEKCFAFSCRSRPEIGIPIYICWKTQAYKALSTCSSLATFRDFGSNASLILNLSVNFRIFSWFLHISEICCLLILNSSAKFVPFSPFSKHKKSFACPLTREQTTFFS